MSLENENETIKNDIQRRCFNFYIIALKGIFAQFNFNDEFLKNLSILHPKNIKSQTSLASIL